MTGRIPVASYREAIRTNLYSCRCSSVSLEWGLGSQFQETNLLSVVKGKSLALLFFTALALT
jgi:hypothetical protein